MYTSRSQLISFLLGWSLNKIHVLERRLIFPNELGFYAKRLSVHKMYYLLTVYLVALKEQNTPLTVSSP
jgi:hypothetical protein